MKSNYIQLDPAYVRDRCKAILKDLRSERERKVKEAIEAVMRKQKRSWFLRERSYEETATLLDRYYHHWYRTLTWPVASWGIGAERLLDYVKAVTYRSMEEGKLKAWLSMVTLGSHSTAKAFFLWEEDAWVLREKTRLAQ